MRHRGSASVLLIVGLSVAVLFGGGTFAAYRYDVATGSRLLPGITVDGVAIGNMSRSQAVAAVSRVVDATLDRDIVVTAGTRSWHTSPRDLGVSAATGAAVDRAFSLSGSYSWPSRVWHRLLGKPVHLDVPVTLAYSANGIEPLVGRVAKAVLVKPRDAAVTLKDGAVSFQHSKAGRTLNREAAVRLLSQALHSTATTVALPVRVLKPAVPDAELGKTIVVDVSRNILHLYDGFKIIRTYPVATAMPGFVTPDGAWSVWDKRVNPTWYNPCLGQPGCWAAGEPPTIPGGPSGPLGTRALYLTASGVRIHGTPSDSSIGHYASHGCIRMHMPDIEALYPLVPVGTPVFIVGAPPWGTSTSSGPVG